MLHGAIEQRTRSGRLAAADQVERGVVGRQRGLAFGGADRRFRLRLPLGPGGLVDRVAGGELPFHLRARDVRAVARFRGLERRAAGEPPLLGAVQEPEEPGRRAVGVAQLDGLLEQRPGGVERLAIEGDAAGEAVDVRVVERRARLLDVGPRGLELADRMTVPRPPVERVADGPASELDDVRQRVDRLARAFQIGEADALAEPRLVVPRLGLRDAFVERQRVARAGDAGDAGEIEGDGQRRQGWP